METNKYLFVHPTRCLISGPSGCGKTEFIRKVIVHRRELFTEVPERVIYTYKYPQKWFSQFVDVEFTQEIPQDLDPSTPSLIVFDDIVCDQNVLRECASIFVRGSHHLNVSVFFITQNLFANSSHYRTISYNTNQFVLFKTPRKQQIALLGRQIYNRDEQKEFMKVYKDATSIPYGYLMVDLDPNQEYPLRTKIFPNEEEIVYFLEQ